MDLEDSSVHMGRKGIVHRDSVSKRRESIIGDLSTVGIKVHECHVGRDTRSLYLLSPRGREKVENGPR